jgi:class 3 adenylate cyclase/CHASE2 domain-containing sensor protein
MRRLDRKLLLSGLGLGAVLTCAVIAADGVGLLSSMEDWLYDLRARTCQFFAPPPTDKLVHLDIDDRAVEVIGRWPWPRAKWAEILDELRLAEPKAVELDVIFSERQDPGHVTLPDGTDKTTDDDALLAAAIKRCGNVILPLSLVPEPAPTRAAAAMVEALKENPELDDRELTAELAAREITMTPTQLTERLPTARRQGIYARVLEETRGGTAPVDADTLRHRLLHKTDPNFLSPIGRLIAEQLERVAAVSEFRRRFSLPVPPDLSGCAAGNILLVPLAEFSRGGAAGAFVDYAHFGGPAVRSVPMLLRHGERAYGQMGLVLACRMLGADLSRARVEGQSLRIPRNGGDDIQIPISPARLTSDGVPVGVLADIPWVGTRDWRTMYDYPNHQRIVQHLSLDAVWDARLTEQKIERNAAQVDEALRALLEILDPPKLTKFLAAPPAQSDVQARVALIDAVLADARETVSLYGQMKPQEIDANGRIFLASANALPHLREQTLGLQADLARHRAELKSAVKDKAVLIGLISTALTDIVSTSLHDRCPGVIVHGAIFNGIMTHHLWRRLPWWITAAVAGILGLATAVATARLSPAKALLAAIVLAGAYLLVNGIVLFDYGDRILGAAGPLMAVGVVWAGGTMGRVIVEQSERHRITRRFSSYADPKLVDYVLEHPEVSFDGEKREMTVVFTDLAGFTSLSERLGEKVVPMLNELLGELVPIIRDRHNGYVNKFLGDGIMFFYNAPMQTHAHAIDAVATVLDMHAAVGRFNQRLAARGLGELQMRAGITTGEMIVGDAGGAGRNDYTVLGDVVNLASRLEAANKYTGTRTLMSAGTAEALAGKVLFRRVGNLKVVGKEDPVQTFEPLELVERATEAQRALAHCSAEMVEAFAAARFADCLQIIAETERSGGPSKLTEMYRGLCQRYVREPPEPGFNGVIVLTEK